MKIKHLIWVAIAAILLAGGSVYATESVVFVDDDPVNSDATVTYVGNWTQSTFFPQTYGQGYHFTRDTGSLTMRANLDIDESGGGADSASGSQFQAFARWSAGNNRCNAVRIDVLNATTNTLITSEIVNQTTQGLQFNWTPIGGRFTAVPNNLYAIRVNAPGVCVTTADGGMFVQQTYDSSDVFNLTAFSIIDEHGIEFDNTPSALTSGVVGNLSTNCAAPTIIKSMSVTVPDSVSTHYVICRATGKTRHTTAQDWVYWTISNNTGTPNTGQTWRYNSSTTATFPASYSHFAMQHVYTVGSEGGSFNYYLRVCRENTTTTGFYWTDDFTCEVTSTRY